MIKPRTIVQLCPELNTGGVERGVVDVACYLQQNGYESIVISNGGSLVPELLLNQVKHIKLPIHSKNPFIFLLNLWRLQVVLNTLKPNLLLPYSRIPTWLVYFLRKKVTIPFITNCLGIHRMGYWGLKHSYNSVLMQGERIIANSHFTKNYFLTHYKKTKSEIRIIARSVDKKFFNLNPTEVIEARRSLRAQWQVTPEKTVLLLPGRFSYWKGQDVLILALNLLKEKNINDYYVVLLGDHQANRSYYKKLMHLITCFNLENDVFFAGNSTQMPQAYAAADIVFSVSTQPEAFGRTIIEAQAMGKLVIASQHGGALETVTDNVTGFLVEPNSANALATTLMKIREMDRMHKAEIALNAQKNACNFSKQKMCEHLTSLYEEIITKHEYSTIKPGIK